MHVHLKSVNVLLEKQAAVVVTVGPDRQLDAAAQLLDEQSQGALSAVLAKAGFEGKLGQSLPLYALPHLACEWVLVTGRGPQDELRAAGVIKLIQTVCKALQELGTHQAVLGLHELQVKDMAAADLLGLMARTAFETTYQFTTYKTTPSGRSGLRDLSLTVLDKSLMTSARRAVAWAEAIAQGTALARDLGNQPSNVCTPTFLSEQAQLLAKASRKIKVKVLGEAQLEKLGAGAFLAVSRGSEEEGKLVMIEYRGTSSRTAPIALIGKGITFDTGGISIKPSAAMDEMKFDMCGAASVLGVMQTLIAAELPVHVVGVLACAENMPSGRARKPGDIVTSMSGQTVEILNTDAEGRLVLCDALTYVQKQYHPSIMIDIATLTGACVVALGKVTSGLFSGDDALAQDLIDAGRISQDPVWRLPLWNDYQELLDSPCADMANIGGPTAGAITAACFLSRFTQGTRWAHLDIAGTAWVSGAKKGATGRPVPLLAEFLKRQVHA